jgi:hypothetical protein
MASSVYHVGLDLELNLTEPDLGYPQLPGLWERLRAEKRPVPQRQLQCMQCRETRPECPEWMFLTERDGVRFASRLFATGDGGSGQNAINQMGAFLRGQEPCLLRAQDRGDPVARLQLAIQVLLVL